MRDFNDRARPPPAAGSGAMVIALAHEMREAGINYQRHLHVTSVDVDAKCVHMAYLQFALLHIPAVIVHGNSLSLEEFGHWYTPAHILEGWSWKLNQSGRNPESAQSRQIFRFEIQESRRIEDRQTPRQEEKPEPPAQLTLF